MAATVTHAYGQADDAGQAIERAKVAIAQGNIPEGEKLLATVQDSIANQNDLDFLRGTIAVAKKDYDAAIAHFKALLNRDPSLNRVRLDLARALFLKGDDEAAEHHFRAAAAQGVPPAVQDSIDVFLDEIRRRKRWGVTVGVAIAPDSNINAATTAQSVNVFGLPFELSDAARQTSGVGVALNLNGSYQWDLTDDTKFKSGVTYNATEYTRHEFTDRQVGIYAGPKFLRGRGTEISVLGTASRRWFGGIPLNYGVGGRIEARTTLSPRLLLDGSIAGQHFHYNAAHYSSYTGPVVAANTALTYAVDFHSFLRGNVGITREQTAVEPFRNTQYTVGGGYYRENLPFRFAIYGGVQATFIRYDAALPAFGGSARQDTAIDYRIGVSNLHIDILGFTPVVSYIHTDRYSNIKIYAYHRDRVEIGVTRNF